jgi:hypothetical protein
MFVVTEAEAAAIRAVYERDGEFAAAVELRRRFPGIGDTAQARECARTIAGWKPRPARCERARSIDLYYFNGCASPTRQAPVPVAPNVDPARPDEQWCEFQVLVGDRLQRLLHVLWRAH